MVGAWQCALRGNLVQDYALSRTDAASCSLPYPIMINSIGMGSVRTQHFLLTNRFRLIGSQYTKIEMSYHLYHV